MRLHDRFEFLVLACNYSGRIKKRDKKWQSIMSIVVAELLAEKINVDDYLPSFKVPIVYKLTVVVTIECCWESLNV